MSIPVQKIRRGTEISGKHRQSKQISASVLERHFIAFQIRDLLDKIHEDLIFKGVVHGLVTSWDGFLFIEHHFRFLDLIVIGLVQRHHEHIQ